MYLPSLEELKKVQKTHPVLMKTFLEADILIGDIESMEFIEELKQQLNDADTDD